MFASEQFYYKELNNLYCLKVKLNTNTATNNAMDR